MSSIATGASIYQGPWVDWSRGPVLGATITLSARKGALLTAFLAFFVTIIGACLWRILCYVFHQFSASPDAKDGIHHQHQLIFRNTSSPAEAARAFAENAFFWRKNGRRAIVRSLPLATFALLFMLGFGVASILTSLITRAAGNGRLIISDNCGNWAVDTNGAESTFAQTTKDLADTNTASAYARTCYGAGAESNALQCGVFIKKSLAFTANDADCPFGDNICNGTSYVVDTQRINSDRDLGINGGPSAQVDLRKVTTCAVLKQDGYLSKRLADGLSGLGATGDMIQHFGYGGLFYDGQELFNETYHYNQHAFVDNYGYQLEATIHPAGEKEQGWIPIAALDRDDADTTIMFMAPNAIRYSTPTQDPFFHAEWEVPLNILGTDSTYWLSDTYMKVMGCTDQYQFCNPLEKDKCTPLSGAFQTLALMEKLGLNQIQQVVARHIAYQIRSTSTYASIGTRGAAALEAQQAVSTLDQAPLPNDQWHIEIRSWFSTGLARLQRTMIAYAAGPDHIMKGSHVEKPRDRYGEALCYSQKVSLTANTISFSVLGIAITMVVGGLIIIIYLVLEMLVSFIQRRWNWGDYRRVRWVMDDKMQIQRMAFEEAGMGNWSKLSSNVPVTEKGQVFGGLRHVDPERPRLGEKWASATTSSSSSSRPADEQDQEPQSAILGQAQIYYPPPSSNPSVHGGIELEKKDGLTVYQKPVYQAMTPPGSTRGRFTEDA